MSFRFERRDGDQSGCRRRDPRTMYARPRLAEPGRARRAAMRVRRRALVRSQRDSELLFKRSGDGSRGWRPERLIDGLLASFRAGARKGALIMLQPQSEGGRVSDRQLRIGVGEARAQLRRTCKPSSRARQRATTGSPDGVRGEDRSQKGDDLLLQLEHDALRRLLAMRGSPGNRAVSSRAIARKKLLGRARRTR